MGADNFAALEAKKEKVDGLSGFCFWGFSPQWFFLVMGRFDFCMSHMRTQWVLSNTELYKMQD